MYMYFKSVDEAQLLFLHIGKMGTGGDAVLPHPQMSAKVQSSTSTVVRIYS